MIKELLTRIVAYLDISERRERKSHGLSRYAAYTVGAFGASVDLTLPANNQRIGLYVFCGPDGGWTDFAIRPLMGDSTSRIFEINIPIQFTQEKYGELIQQELYFSPRFDGNIVVIEKILQH